MIALLAAKNLLRNKFRTVMTVAALVITVVAFLALRTVLTSWYAGIEAAAKDRIGSRNKVTFIMPLPRSFVDKVRAAEASLGSTKLSEAVARYLFKLMAYKDEYEVARLHTDPAFTQKIADMFDGDVKIVHHLAPPTIAKRNAKGELIKQPFGPWMRTAFAWLAKMRGLRGHPPPRAARTESAIFERKRQKKVMLVAPAVQVDEASP